MAKQKLHHTLIARILHWQNAAVIVLLAVTGMYIRDPVNYNFFPNMDMARKIHFIAMYLIVFGTLIRLYYSCINKDYREIFFRFKDIKTLPKVIKYYLFLTRTLPRTGRYNPGQKALYNAWVLMIIFQAATGFILYSPEALIKYAPMFGGPVFVRQAHFIITWGFIITAAVHVYFSFLSGWYVIKSMFTGVKENHIDFEESFSL